MIDSIHPKNASDQMDVMLSGAHGQFGRAIEAVLETENSMRVVARYDRATGFAGQAIGHVIIDVSHHSQTPDVVAFALDYQLPLVIGTTALSEATQAQIIQAGEHIAICQASNFSLGANVLAQLAALAAKHLPEFGVHIKETHHIHKLDAPSGTAKSLQAAIEKVSDQGITHESIREGDVVGTHEVVFSGIDETLTLCHEATDRRVFAHGAVLAAAKLIGRPAGLYALTDLI
ncbi:MAG TPA: dihydrodipicolinate reductase C-terminal domain-containing protein [Wenzhouxiangella sp.]